MTPQVFEGGGGKASGTVPFVKRPVPPTVVSAVTPDAAEVWDKCCDRTAAAAASRAVGLCPSRDLPGQWQHVSAKSCAMLQDDG